MDIGETPTRVKKHQNHEGNPTMRSGAFTNSVIEQATYPGTHTHTRSNQMERTDWYRKRASPSRGKPKTQTPSKTLLDTYATQTADRSETKTLTKRKAGEQRHAVCIESAGKLACQAWETSGMPKRAKTDSSSTQYTTSRELSTQQNK